MKKRVMFCSKCGEKVYIPGISSLLYVKCHKCGDFNHLLFHADGPHKFLRFVLKLGVAYLPVQVWSAGMLVEVMYSSALNTELVFLGIMFFAGIFMLAVLGALATLISRFLYPKETVPNDKSVISRKYEGK